MTVLYERFIEPNEKRTIDYLPQYCDRNSDLVLKVIYENRLGMEDFFTA